MSKRILLFSLGISLLAGCSKPEDATVAPEPKPAAQTQQQQDQSGGSVAPISPSVGGISPVAGSDSVTGAGGGGVSQAAKERAKAVAGSQSNTPPPPTDE